MFSMFKICCWYNTGEVEKNTAEKIAIKCSNCGKETIIDMDNINTTYQDIITSFVFKKISLSTYIEYFQKNGPLLFYR